MLFPTTRAVRPFLLEARLLSSAELGPRQNDDQTWSHLKMIHSIRSLAAEELEAAVALAKAIMTPTSAKVPDADGTQVDVVLFADRNGRLLSSN